VDGSTTTDIARQIPSIPEDATNLVLSVGGNDALAHADVLTRKSITAMEVLEYLASVTEQFESKYRAVARELTALGKPLLVCTVYNGNLPPELATAARAAVAAFNDKIYQIAGELSLAVLELRRVCAQPSDYANQIEPSALGGRKIAAGILASLARTDPLRHTFEKMTS
jgi:hypothetical protein